MSYTSGQTIDYSGQAIPVSPNQAGVGHYGQFNQATTSGAQSGSGAVAYDAMGSYDSSETYDNPSAAVGVDALAPSTAVVSNYSDQAFPVYLSRAVSATDTVIWVTSTNGYPTPPFFICIDPWTLSAANPAQEVCQVTAVTSQTMTVVRSYDGGGATPHAVGALVSHSLTALDFTTMNHHCYVTSVDWHPQYMDVFRHSLHPHLMGGAIGLPSTVSSSAPGDVAQANPTGSTLPAPAGHVHGRESVSQVLSGAFISGMGAVINTLKSTTFAWLPQATASVTSPYPALLVTSLNPSLFNPLAFSASGTKQSHAIPLNPSVGTYKK